MAEVDSLEIRIEASAKSSLQYLDKVQSKLDDITKSLKSALELSSDFGKLGKIDLKGFEDTNKTLDSISKKAKSISKQSVSPKINTKDIDKATKSLDDLFDKFKNAGRNIDLSDMGLTDLQKEADRTEKTVKRLNDRLEKKISLEGTNKLGKSWESLVFDIQKATNQAELYQEAIKKIQNTAPKLTITRGTPNESDVSNVNTEPKATRVSPESLNYDADAMRMVFGEEAASLRNFNDVMEKFGVNASEASRRINELEESFNAPKVNTYEAQIKRLKAELSDLGAKGFKQGDSEYDEVARELARVTEQKKKYDKEMSRSVKVDAGTKSLSKSLQGIKKTLQSATNSFSKFGKSASKAISGIVSMAVKLKKALIGTQKQANGMSFGRMIGSSVAFLFVFQGISAIQNAIKEGSNNLVQYSSVYNNSISSIVSSLLYLKNAWAAAFAPIINVVAPLVSKFVDIIASALNAVGIFMAALTGKGTVVQAKKVWQDYGTSLSDVGSGAKDASKGLDDAAKSAKDFQTYILGIDELNVQPQTDTSSSSGSGGSGGGSGSGGGGGIISPSDMFETIETDGAVANFAKRLREAFLAEDWEGLGNILANAVNSGLQKLYDVINWDNVGPKITKFANAFTRTFNSLVDNIDWDLLGRTVGAGINTLANTFNLLFGEGGINFNLIGEKLSVGLRGAIAEVNWIELGKAIGNYFMISWRTFLGFVSGMSEVSEVTGLTGWQELGLAIADGINGAFESISLEDIGTAIGLFVSGIIEMLRTAISKIEWGDIVDELKNGLFNAFSGASDGGENNGILAGLLGIGAIAGISKLIEPVKNAVSILSTVVGGLSSAFGEIGTAIGTISAPVAIAVAALALLAAGLGYVFATNEEVRNSFFNATDSIANGFAPMIQFVTDTLLPGLQAGWDTLIQILTPFGEFLNTVFVSIWQDMINPALTYIGETVLPILTETFENLWKNVLEPAGNFIASVLSPVIEILSGILTMLWQNIIVPLAGFIGNVFSKAFEGICEILNNTVIPIVKTVISVFQFLWDNVFSPIVSFLWSVFQPAFEGVFKAIGGIIDGLSQAFGGLIDFVTGVFSGNWEKAWNGVKDIFGGIWNALKSLVASPINGLIGALESGINFIIGGLNKFLGGVDDVVGSLGDLLGYDLGVSLIKEVKFPRIEGYEKGGFPKKASLFFAGEKGIPEMLGTVGGKTAVAGGQEITGITTAIYSVGQTIASLLQGIISLIGSSGKSLDVSTEVDVYASSSIGELPEGEYTKSGKELVGGFNNGIAQNISTTQKVIQNYMGAVKKDISVNLSIITQVMLDLFVNAWNSIKTVFSPTPEFFNDTFSLAYENVKLAFQFMGTWFQEKWNSVKNVFRDVVQFFKEKFESAYNAVKNAFEFINSWFQGKWDAVKGVFRDVASFFKSAFGSAYEAVKAAFSGISDFFKGIFNSVLRVIGNAVNGIIDGVNWIADKLGAGKPLANWDVPQFASGSNGLPQDTVGVVNDQAGSTYKELIVPPHGQPFIPEGRNVMLPMEKGTKIMPAGQTKDFLDGIPRFKSGIGEFFGGSWEKATNFTGSVWDYITNPGKIVQIAIDKFTDISGWVGVWGNIASGLVSKTFDYAVDFVKNLFDKASETSYDPSAGVEQWREIAKRALQMTGQYSEANLSRLLMQMQTESGGNPNAINNWDINAINGTPSKGLMQVIDPTFQAYAYPGFDKNIYDPLSNILASIRYTLSRYGSLAAGWQGHGYATGIGKISLSDLIPAYSVGGFPEDGLFFKNNDELYGKIGGKPAVAPTPDIQAGIEEAAYRGFSRANAENRRQEALLEELIQAVKDGKDIIVDGRSLVSAIDNRRSRNGFSFT